MGIRIVNPQQGEETQAGNTQSAHFVLGQNRSDVRGTGQPSHEPGTEPSGGNAVSQQEYEQLQHICRWYQSRIQKLEMQNGKAVERISELTRLCQELREQQEQITPEDLEDTQSIIEEQRARIAELERLVNENAGAAGSKQQRLEEELETARQELNREVHDREQAVRERDEAVRERDEAARERDKAVLEREQAARERDEARSALNTYKDMSEASGRLQAGQEELENIRAQISEMEKEKGAAFERLKELNLRYRKDLRYIEFYQKLPEQKIDGLELLRRKLEGLNKELEKVLDQGLRKAYVFRSTQLAAELDEARQKHLEILTQMRELVEDFELSKEEAGVTLGEMSTEECRRQAEEALEKYENTLKQMYDVSEKVLRIKNTIAFSFDSTLD